MISEYTGKVTAVKVLPAGIEITISKVRGRGPRKCAGSGIAPSAGSYSIKAMINRYKRGIIVKADNLLKSGMK